jgi:phosphate starvation-inducible protein PhoH and related proteins
MKRTRRKKITRAKPAPPPPPEGYSAKTRAQAHALDVIGRSTISFVLGPAGTGKTHLASGYAVQAVLDGRAEQIVITRPSVATEQLGFLPGSAEEKVGPYLVPFFDAVDRIAGKRGQHREKIAACIKVAPLAYLRGRTFHNSVMVFDEAQNATFGQLKLFLTRIGSGSQVIVTGDADQSDLPPWERRLVDVMQRLSGIKGVGVVEFKASDIVRNPIIEGVLRELER